MVYEIRKYDLIGKALFTCKERPDLEMRQEHGMKKYFYKDGSGLSKSHFYEYTTIKKVGAFNPEDKFLPYFADVTEDLPGSIKLEPKTYKNCQLMTETHGGYLQFWHEETKQVLRIAFNSHYYTPIEKEVG